MGDPPERDGVALRAIEPRPLTLGTTPRLASPQIAQDDHRNYRKFSGITLRPYHKYLLFSMLAILSVIVSAITATQLRHHKHAALGFIDPRTFGGHANFTFQNSPTTKPEPLNIIISALSAFPSNTKTGLAKVRALDRPEASVSGSLITNSTAILYERNGLANWLNALNFSDECLHLHLSTPAYAAVSNATPGRLDFLYRDDYGVLNEQTTGSCRETLDGGYHFRGFRQNQTGAWFLGASQELNLTQAHNLVPDGYDLGRNEIVRRARIGGIDGNNCSWPAAEVRNVRGILQEDHGGSTGAWNHDIGIDGIIKLLTVGPPVCPK